MININEYIIEKLHLNKDIKVDNTSDDAILPNSPEAQELCDKYNDDKNTPWQMLIGEADGGGKHFFLRPKEKTKISEPLGKSSYIMSLYLKDISKYIGHLYIVVSKYSAIDRSSRINNLKRTYYDFYFGSRGEIFNDKKDANAFLKASRNNYECGLTGEYNKTFKVMTIKEASAIEGSYYGNHIGDIKFRLEL